MEEIQFNLFLNNLRDEEKRLYRKYEKTYFRIITTTKAIAFTENCIREKLCPKTLYRGGLTSRKRQHVEELLRQRNIDNLRRLEELGREKQMLYNDIRAIFREDLLNEMDQLLNIKAENHSRIVDTRLTKKLITLNNGHVRTAEHTDSYINLSELELTEDQKEFLNLGLKCPYIRKPHSENKRINTEILIDRLLDLQAQQKVLLSPTVIHDLVGESGIDRNVYFSKIVDKRMREAAKSLRDDPSIIIRKADKSSVYVIMNRSQYNEKMNVILGDETKFKRLASDPTETLKRRISGLNIAANALQKEVRFPKVEGDFSPGYCYGTVKTHKQGNPLRPIIAQMTTPTYWTAKELNKIITPFIMNPYSLTSNLEFVDILRSTTPGRTIASLDVENLFTNVPVEETIGIILDRIYRSEMTPLNVPEHILREQLLACTTEAPFFSHTGELFCQVDGVSMGSPLGVLFAEAYMAEVERRVFTSNPKPRIYTRFRDDIMLAVDEEEEIERISTHLKTNSVLNFTVELSSEGKLPYLDVMITQHLDHFGTDVYIKPTNVGKCMNARGECPDTYKRSVIAAYVRRALHYCTTWPAIHRELDRVRQLLTNNGYQDSMIEEVIGRRIAKFLSTNPNPKSENNTITLYHNISYGSRYTDEVNALKKIIDRGVQTVDERARIALRVYCRSHLTASLVMRNSTAPKRVHQEETDVVYEFVCPVDACQHRNINYIGLTRKTLKGRMKAHSYGGAINEHFTDVHKRRPKVDELVCNTTIIHREPERKRLAVAEAVSIALRRPKLNVQCEFDFVLPSCRRRAEPALASSGAPEQGQGAPRNAPAARAAISSNSTVEGPRRRLRLLPHRV